MSGIKSILELKTPDLFTCRADHSVLECIQVMNRHKIGALIVMNLLDKVDGIVTERDILREIHNRKGVLGQVAVNEIMTPKSKLVVADQNDPVEKIMELMTEKRIRHIPVMERERLIGMISIGDVVKALFDKALVENKWMKSYISGS